MMISQKFDIKVALLGYVSVGKTTVLNALLRDKFSEVSMRRTTAGINFFRILTPNPEDLKESEGNDNSNRTGVTETDQWSVVADDETTKAAADVLKEIEASNQELRETKQIEERNFNIQLDTPLCEMRNDTTLTIVDIPGINEADTNSIYMKYVKENWKSFDCVVAVMDARQGVNTEEQLALLKLIKNNLSSHKQLPVIILFNKVDEPDDSEQASLVNEATNKISELFAVDCSDRSLQQFLEAPAGSGSHRTDSYPIFIPTSAVHAFFYRTAALLTYKQFKDKFDMDLIDKMGREEIGRFRWKKLSKEEKYQAVFEAVSGNSNYEERLETTNFDKFLKVLSLTVGGKETQTKLLENQLDVALGSLPNSSSFEHVRSIYDKSLVLGKEMGTVKKKFWSLYENTRKTSMKTFGEQCKVEALVEPVAFLEKYLTFASSLGWEDDVNCIREKACKLVRQQLGMLVNKLEHLVKAEETANVNHCAYCQRSRPHKESTLKSPWQKLTYNDWLSIFDSILLMSFNKQFCQELGREKILLGQLKHKYTTVRVECFCSSCNYSGYCKACGFQIIVENSTDCRRETMKHWDLRFNGESLEAHGSKENGINIEIPASLSDPKHWGHIAWKCCNLLEALDSKMAEKPNDNVVVNKSK